MSQGTGDNRPDVSAGAAQTLYSQYADDPDFAPLLAVFVEELPDRVDQMNRAWLADSLEEVARQAHQLKGAGGGYGYPQISDTARALEEAVRSEQLALAEQLIEQMRQLSAAARRAIDPQ
jgi:HPt (histidine-containing phosphotransfer) domain-containing protein